MCITDMEMARSFISPATEYVSAGEQLAGNSNNIKVHKALNQKHGCKVVKDVLFVKATLSDDEWIRENCAKNVESLPILVLRLLEASRKCID